MMNQTEIDFFMGEAIQLAKEAGALGDVPVGAVVVFGGEIVGRGKNARVLDCDPIAHAETLALSEAGRRLGRWNLEGCTLFVTLEPCAMCAGAISNARIDRVYFGAADLRFGALKGAFDYFSVAKTNHSFEVVGQIRQEECASLLIDFFKDKRKR